MDEKKPEEQVEIKLTEADAAPAPGLSPDPEVPISATEKDIDSLVHEKTAIETEIVVETETDLDTIVHEQAPVPPPIDSEKDLDDLMHPRV